MQHHMKIYRPSTESWCYRLIRSFENKAWDNVAGALAAAPTFANTAIALTHDANLGCFPVTIPAAVPAGDYDLVFYNVAAASLAITDASSFGYRIGWNGQAITSIQVL